MTKDVNFQETVQIGILRQKILMFHIKFMYQIEAWLKLVILLLSLLILLTKLLDLAEEDELRLGFDAIHTL